MLMIIYTLISFMDEAYSFMHIDLDFTTSMYPTGMVDSFLDLVINHEHFVDKSLLIKDYLSTDQTIIVTRPRRWGKSINMDMLRMFLQVQVNDDGIPVPRNILRVFFEGGCLQNNKDEMKCLKPLKIAQLHPDIVEQHQGKYPVIHFNSMFFHAGDRLSIKKVIGNLYTKDYNFLKKYINKSNATAAVHGDDVKLLQRYIKRDNHPLDDIEALKLLIKVASAHFNNSPVYVLIDEYDHFLNDLNDPSASDDQPNLDRYNRHIEILRNLLAGVFQRTRNVRGMLTGVSIAAKQEASKNSSLCNITEDTLWDPVFVDHYGFAEEEIDSLLPTSVLYAKSATIKHWYKGYQIAGKTFYNPFSVMECLSSGEIAPHWVERESLNEQVDDDEINNELCTLMYSNTYVALSMPRQIVHFTVGEKRREDFYTHLLIHGYASVTRISENYYNFSLPTYEIRDHIFHFIVEYWLLDELAINETQYYSENYNLSRVLTNYKMPSIEETLNNILDAVGIVYPSHGEREIKNFYENLLTLFLFPVSSHFTVHRYSRINSKDIDFVIIPATGDVDKQDAIIMRFAVSNCTETLLSSSKSALDKIYNSSYRDDVIRNVCVKNIYSIGVALHKNKAYVEYKLEQNPNCPLV